MPTFRRRIGALADIKELEYVAALHQTCMPRLRENGTVSSVDICRFIKSRTGLNVSDQDSIRLVRGLGGGVVGEDVIQQILQVMGDLEEAKKQEKKRLKARLDLTKSVGGLFNKSRKSRANVALAQEQDIEIEKMVHEQDLLTMEKTKDPEEEKEEATTEQEKDGVPVAKDGQTQEEQVISGATEAEDPKPTLSSVSQEEFLDIVQLMAALLMPTLARAGKEWQEAETLQVHEEAAEPQTDEGIVTGWFNKRANAYKTRKKLREDAIHESLEPKPATMLHDVFMLLLQSLGDAAFVEEETFPVLDAQLVRTLLLRHGEYERAADDVLVDKMVEAASSPTGLFNEESFVHALTSDLGQWKVGSEDNQTTSFFDVWSFESYREKAIVEAEREAFKQNEGRDEISKVKSLDEKSGDVEIAAALDSGDKAENQADNEVEVNYLEEKSSDVEIALDGGNAGIVENPADNHEDEIKQAEEELSVNEKDDYIIDRPRSAIDIDFSVDAFSSVSLTVIIFFFFICTSLVYATLIQQIPALNPQCGQEFACILVSKVVTWLIFAVVLTGTGYIVIIPLSIGNSPEERSPLRSFVALISAVIITWIPFIVVTAYQRSIEPPYEAGTPAGSVNDLTFSSFQWITRFCGMLVILFLLIQLIIALVGQRRIRASELLSNLFVTSHVRGTARSKKAATRKINAILQHAHSLHPKKVSRQASTVMKEDVMANFVLQGEMFEDCGGLMWTWKRVFSGALFDEEGIWIMSRLIIIQTAQFLFFAIFTFAFLLVINEAAVRAEEASEGLQPGNPQWVYDIVPTASQVRIALYPALAVAMFDMLTICFIYIPSYTGRIIRYRCGLLPSLKSIEFIRYRIAVDTVYVNIGNAIFAMIGSSVLFFILVGLTIFLFIWDFSRNLMLLLVAWLLGLVITIVLKQILVRWCRKRNYAGFYRTKPSEANLTSLALECWFIGLGGGVLVGRLVSFLLAACFFIGRIDVPFLSKDVALGGYHFDAVPTCFVKDILVHEAHRHPYLERLLAMYLQKLKTDSFCSEAGACWRQLFVVALMPWFQKLRVFSDKRLENKCDVYNAHRSESLTS